MRSICLYFQVHQPNRLRRYRFFDIGNDHYYYDDYTNKSIIKRIANNCYIPANKIMLDLVKKHGDKFKVCFSLTGTVLEQFEKHVPEVIDSFAELAKTGNVEFLAETYSHSLSSLISKEEFFSQVNLHVQKIEELFGYTPKVFRNTELIYSDAIGEMVGEMGYRTMLTEGAKHILGWKSPNFLYYCAHNPRVKIMLKNYKLSDDLAFRFSDRNWNEWPLTTQKYVQWLKDLDDSDEIVNLFLDYESFGEHQWEDTGIFDFLKAFPDTLLKESDFQFSTPSEVSKKHQPVAAFNVPYPISWADEERDLSAWLGNELQQDAYNKLYELQQQVSLIKDKNLLKDWFNLQNSDHFYYMCTKFFSDGDVHMYFNPYASPYDAYINYMNVLSDFKERVSTHIEEVKEIGISGEENLDELIHKYEEKLISLKEKYEVELIRKREKEKLRIAQENLEKKLQTTRLNKNSRSRKSKKTSTPVATKKQDSQKTPEKKTKTKTTEPTEGIKRKETAKSSKKAKKMDGAKGLKNTKVNTKTTVAETKSATQNRKARKTNENK